MPEFAEIGFTRKLGVTMLATRTNWPASMGALVRFGLLALVPVVALGAVLAHVLNADVQQRYLETARSSASLITQVGIQPLLNAQEVESGLGTLDEIVTGACQVCDFRSAVDRWASPEDRIEEKGLPEARGRENADGIRLQQQFAYVSR